jgi:Gas vesicle synthesis protein GvpL/GvpF
VTGTGDASVYVYGVLPASDRARVSVGGVEGAQVRTIEHGGLAALVSTVEAGASCARIGAFSRRRRRRRPCSQSGSER